MLHFTDYAWYHNYIDSDIQWIDETVNWDEAISFSLTSFFPLMSVLTSYFSNSHFSTDWVAVTSLVEIITTYDIFENLFPTKLMLSLMLDVVISFYLHHGFTFHFLYHSDYQDWVLNILHNSPELVLAFDDWVASSYMRTMLMEAASAVFTSYVDSPYIKLSEIMEFTFLLLMYFWAVVLVSELFRLRVVSRLVNPYLTRLKLYFSSYSYESRLQSEAVLESFFLVVLFFTMMVMTFDDDKEELTELINLSLFYLFLSIFVVHLCKYSCHYLSFLDTSRKSTSAVVFLSGQFLFDLLNLIGFTLRFLLLMARLNIYDGVDDVLESNYIFLIDFDEDEYYSETFLDFTAYSFFDTDVHDDRSFLLEDEVDLSTDLFTIYAILWGKYVLYLTFVLEEFARVGLALFVTYLIIFEINTLNRSYNESNVTSDNK